MPPVGSNIEAVIAIELLSAAQSLDLRLKQAEKSKTKTKLGIGTAAAHQRIRDQVSYLDRDRVLYLDIRTAIRLVRSGELVHLTRQVTG